jgi:hypothetical protein
MAETSACPKQRSVPRGLWQQSGRGKAILWGMRRLPVAKTVDPQGSGGVEPKR